MLISEILFHFLLLLVLAYIRLLKIKLLNVSGLTFCGDIVKNQRTTYITVTASDFSSLSSKHTTLFTLSSEP